MNINVSGNYTLELTPDAFLTQTANIYLQCKTAGAPVNITLPRITTLGGVTTTWGFKIYVNDVDGSASVNNIKLIPHPADRINGSGASIILNTNRLTGHLQPTGISAWEFSLGSSSSGGSGTLLFNSFPEFSIDSFDASEKSILPTSGIGSSIIPANFLSVGKKLSIKIGGVIGYNTEPFNVTYGDNPFLIYFGSAPFLQLNLASTLSGFVGAENQFLINAEMTIQNGQLIASAGSIVMRGGATESLLSFSPLAFIPTIPQPIDIRIAFGGGNEGNGTNVRTTIMSIESPSLI